MSNPQIKIYAAPSGQMISGQVFNASGFPDPLLFYNAFPAQSILVTAASGYSSIGFSGYTVTGFVIGSDPSVLQSDLNALPVLSPSGTVVTGLYPYRITFTDTNSKPSFTVNTSNLTATSAPHPLTAGSTSAVKFDCSSVDFSTVGSWVSAIAGTSVNIVATGTGLNQCQWLIPGFATGNYQVYMNFGVPGSTASTTTPVRIFNGSQPILSFPFNQQGFQNQDVVLGVSVQLVGTTYIQSGKSIRVLITDMVQPSDIGQIVSAFQIVFVPIDPSAPIVFTIFLNVSYVFTAGSWHNFNPGTAGWNGSAQFSDAPGSTSTWEWPGLPYGLYSVQVQYPVRSDFDPQSSWQVYDGLTPSGPPIILNQALALSGGLTLVDNNSVSLTFGNLGNAFPVTSSLGIRLVATSSSFGGVNAMVSSAALVSLQSLTGYAETVSSAINQISAGPPSITIDNGPPVFLTSAIYRNDPNNPANCIPFMEWPLSLSSPLTPNNNVKFSASPNTFTNISGVIPQITNQQVINKVGSRLSLPNPNPITTGAGYNWLPPGTGLPLFSNNAANCSSILFNGPNQAAGHALTSLGYPQVSTFERWQLEFGVFVVNPLSSAGYPNWPNGGISTFIWSGSTAFYPLIGASGGTRQTFVSIHSGQATGNIIQVVLEVDGSGTTIAPVFDANLLCLTDYGDDADTGKYSFIGSWPTLSGGYNGSHRTNLGISSSKAICNMGNVPAGTYLPFFSYNSDPGNTTTATYTFKENGSIIHTSVVNQRIAPTGFQSNDLSSQTITFNSTGETVTFGGGLITIELTGGNDGVCVLDCIGYQITGNIVSGTPFVPFTKFEAYDPLVDYTNPPEFHPLFISSNQGLSVARSMQLMGANDSGMVEFLDYAQPGQLCYGAGSNVPQYALTKVSNWNSPTPWFQNNKVGVLFTVSPINNARLPLVTGTPISLPNNIIVNWTSGGTSNFSLYFSSVYHDNTMGSNQFVMGNGFIGDVSGSVIEIDPTPPATSLGSCGVSMKSIPWASFFRLCNQLKCKDWINITLIASVDCIQKIAQLRQQIRPIGQKGYVEGGNEPWNFLYPFFQYNYGISVVNSLGDPQKGYAFTVSNMYSTFKGQMGSRASEISGVYNCAAANPSTAQSVFDYCNPLNIPVDFIAPAPYLGASPAAEPGLDPIYTKLFSAQGIDCIDGWLAFGNSTQTIAATYQAMAQANTTLTGRLTRWSCYEGGIDFNAMGGTLQTQISQSIAWRYHPQEGSALQGYLSTLQFYGCVDVCIYNLDQPPGGDFATSVYGVYDGWQNPPGPGFNNLPYLTTAPPGLPNFLGGESPMGYAIQQWNAGLNGLLQKLYMMRQRITN